MSPHIWITAAFPGETPAQRQLWAIHNWLAETTLQCISAEMSEKVHKKSLTKIIAHFNVVISIIDI